MWELSCGEIDEAQGNTEESHYVHKLKTSNLEAKGRRAVNRGWGPAWGGPGLGVLVKGHTQHTHSERSY